MEVGSDNVPYQFFTGIKRYLQKVDSMTNQVRSRH
jgi:hypothetical protein